jgi:hypothetical protein
MLGNVEHEQQQPSLVDAHGDRLPLIGQDHRTDAPMRCRAQERGGSSVLHRCGGVRRDEMERSSGKKRVIELVARHQVLDPNRLIVRRREGIELFHRERELISGGERERLADRGRFELAVLGTDFSLRDPLAAADVDLMERPLVRDDERGIGFDGDEQRAERKLAVPTGASGRLRYGGNRWSYKLLFPAGAVLLTRIRKRSSAKIARVAAA